MKRILMLAALTLAISAFTVNLLSAAPAALVHFNQETIVGQSLLPAGDYTIQLINLNSDTVLLFQSKAKSTFALANQYQPNESTHAPAAAVTLEHDSKGYHVTKVVIEGRGFEVQ